MTQVLISILILITHVTVKAEPPVEVQAAIKSAEAYDKACEKHEFRPYREKKIQELNREDYFKLKDMCASYSMASTLRAVQNINKLEKENIAKLSKLSEADKAKNIESRIRFLTDAIVNIPMTFAETLIVLVALQGYKKEADLLKNNDLQKFLNLQKNRIKANKEKIFKTSMRHDITNILAEYRNTKGGSSKEIEEFYDFVTKFSVYSNEIKNNLSCLSMQECKICGDKFEKKCSEKFIKLNTNSNPSVKMIRDRYAEATEYFFKRVDKL